MADDIFGAGEDRDVAAVRQRGEQQRRCPGVVDDRQRARRPGRRGDRWHVLHLEGQAARAFAEHRARGLADHVGDPCTDRRIVIARRYPHPLEQSVAQCPRRAIDAVDHQQLVARREQREQARPQSPRPLTDKARSPRRRVRFRSAHRPAPIASACRGGRRTIVRDRRVGARRASPRRCRTISSMRARRGR